MELYDSLNPIQFLTFDGHILYPKLSQFVGNIIGTITKDTYFFVIERVGNEYSEFAYIIDTETFADMFGSDLISIIEENKFSIIANLPSRSLYDPVSINLKKYGDFRLPETMEIVIKINGEPVIRKELMKVYFIDDKDALFDKLLDCHNYRKTKNNLALINEELWEKEIEDAWDGEIVGPYKLSRKRKVNKVFNNEQEFYDTIFDSSEFNCWLMKDNKFGTSILSGFEEDDLIMRIFRFKSL
jgi:hypothetical protein